MASSFPPQEVRGLVQEIATLLRERKETVSVAETACGGIISASLLATPGASGFYKGGLTLYTLPSRVEFAGWTQSDIDTYDGPTPKIVAGLAENVREKLKSTYCVSESGTAGPSASGKKPNRQPDYLAIAVASEKGTFTREMTTGLGGDREANMVQFTVEALKLLKDVMEGKAKQ